MSVVLPLLVSAAGCLSITSLDEDYTLGPTGAGNAGAAAGGGTSNGGAAPGGQGGQGAATTTSTSSASSGAGGAGGDAGEGGLGGGALGGAGMGGAGGLGAAGGAGGAGAAGGVGGSGGTTGNGGSGGSIVWSCDDQYGLVSGYVACPSAQTECVFSVNTSGVTSCDAVCESVGGECLHAWDNGAACQILQASTCDYSGYSTTMCGCSLGCGSGPPCQAPDVCSGGSCG